MTTQPTTWRPATRSRRWPRYLLGAVCIPLLVSTMVHAQKGMGDPIGVARQGLKPSLVELSGTIVSVETHPCAKTTGRAVVGTHLIVKGADGQQYNLHLGPAYAVASLTESLQPGQAIEAVVFRTPQMPENQYVVSTLRLGAGKVVQLRDSSLRPSWSRQGRLQSSPNQGFPRYGQGRGWGCGWGRCMF
jgi:hypothetical protein